MPPTSTSFAAPWGQTVTNLHPAHLRSSRICGAVYAIAASLSVGYRVEHDHLIIKHLIGDVRIPLVGLSQARLMSPDEAHGAARIWVVGCFFGYFGDS